MNPSVLIEKWKKEGDIMASKKELRALITLAGKIDPSLQAAMMKASKMNINMAQQSKKSAGAMSGVWNIAKGVFAGNLLTRGLAMTINGIKAVGSQGIQLASDLTEVQNVVDTTFGGSSNQIDDWSKKALNAFGLSELQAKKFNGTMGAMLKSSGISSQYLVKMSEGVTGLTGDFASFYNLDQEEAFDKIRAGLSGETEPLRQLGINMSVANLEAFALSKGITTSYQGMDQASQTLLRYNYLMSVSKDAQGDFAKTLDTSYANQKRLFTTNLSQKMAGLWNKSLPMLTKGFSLLNKSLSGINVDALGNTLSDKLGVAFNLIMQYGPMVVDNIKKIPPIISEVYDKVKWVADLLINNWPAIEPIVWGITGAILAYKGAMLGLVIQQKAGMIINALSKGWAMATFALQAYQNGARLATVAQMLFNGTLLANPITWVVVGIGALIAAGVLLYKNWDTVSAFLSKSWDVIKYAFSSSVNWVVNKLNWLIEKMNLVPGINIPLIPTMQTGESLKGYATGGFSNKPAIFGEAGLEAAIPIKYRNPRSISILNQTAKAIGADGSGSRPPISLTFNFNGPVNNKEEVTSAVKEAKEYILDVLEEYFGGEGRPSFG